MKATKRKNILGLPYSLHDARVCRIETASEQIIFWFDAGYFKPVDDDCLTVKGHIAIEDVNFDFCNAYLMDTANECGKFSGEKFSLQRFIESFPTMNFEIIDETYGYNQSKFSGFFYMGAHTRECIIEIYHHGPMTYFTEE